MGVPPNAIPLANRDFPQKVQCVHESYLEAGAHILTANSFGVREGERLAEYARRGALLAEQVADESPFSACVWLSLTAGFVRSEREALPTLVAGRAVVVETVGSLLQAEEVVKILLEAKPILLAVTCHFRATGLMPDRSEPEIVARRLSQTGVDIMGANCGETPESFLDIAERLRANTSLPLLIQPSAGLPTRNSLNEWSYPTNDEAFANIAKGLFERGVNIVGGCCGTTPKTIVRIAQHCF
jgi:methionine synthase I (cobalamin-dependent)